MKYQILKKDEIIKRGDERFSDVSKMWVETVCDESEKLTPRMTGFTYRRKAKQ